MDAFSNAGVWSRLGAGGTTTQGEACQQGVYFWHYRQSGDAAEGTRALLLSLFLLPLFTLLVFRSRRVFL